MDVKVWKKGEKGIPKDAVFVGRPTIYGNPFVMRKESDRDIIYDKFEEYIANDTRLKNLAKVELRGKHLVCYCSPKRCHADTLLRIANE